MNSFRILVAAVAVIVASDSALACKCPANSLAKASELITANDDALKDIPPANAIIIGRIASQAQNTDNRAPAWNIQVLQNLKGKTEPTVTLRDSKGGDCGIDLPVSSIAVIVMSRAQNNEWSTNLCDLPEQDISSERLIKFVQEKQR
ncbi:hypothetical protein [Microvirga sp. Mcv34]|uniref:hypothetical protein n=1 Tax=Microvirga sp. Mcv34 TaxID=2926016 RepID=UPI0021C8BD92|nr:hypothetical protein [Microvirga sp. Mcv34]